MADSSVLEPRKRPRQRRSQQTVDAILEATARILVSEGYDKTSTNRVAKLAGVSVGSLYQYFPNKQALVLAVAKRHGAQMVDLLATTAIDLADAPIDVAVRSYVKAMVLAHRTEGELHRVLAAHALMAGLEQFREIDDQARAIVKLWLQAHQDEIIVKDLDAAAFMLVMSVDILLHAHAVYDLDEVSNEALEEELIAMITRYLMGTP